MDFKPINTLRQRLTHAKEQKPKHNTSNIVYAVQYKEECSELYIGETASKQENGPAQEGQRLRATISSVPSFEGQRTLI